MARSAFRWAARAGVFAERNSDWPKADGHEASATKRNNTDSLFAVKRSHFLVLGTATLFGWVFSCARPTQAVLRVVLQSPCATETGPEGVTITNVVIYAGKDAAQVAAREKAHAFVAELACDKISTDSTLVLHPGSGSTSAVVRVVAGVQQFKNGAVASILRADKCGVRDGCIRATRAFQYVDNDTVEIPIALDVICAGTICPGETTCVQGTCVSSSCRNGSTNCLGETLPSADASALDVGLPPIDAGVDVGIPDAAPIPNAFKCANGEAAWTVPPTCSTTGASCYVPGSPIAACSTKPNACLPGFLPCCFSAHAKGATCCLSKDERHPIQVGVDLDQTGCSDKELCFPKDIDPCPGLFFRPCIPLEKESEWGYCGSL